MKVSRKLPYLMTEVSRADVGAGMWLWTSGFYPHLDLITSFLFLIFHSFLGLVGQVPLLGIFLKVPHFAPIT